MRAKQTKFASLVESLLNVAIGYGVAVLTQVVVFPWFGIYIGVKEYEQTSGRQGS